MGNVIILQYLYLTDCRVDVPPSYTPGNLAPGYVLGCRCGLRVTFRDLT